MLLVALASSLLLGPAASDAEPQWASSIGIARLEAKRQGRPLLAVFTPAGRGYWLMSMLTHPEVRPSINPFVLVGIDTPKDFSRLAPKVEIPPFAQLVFLNPDGSVLKRLSGYLRPTDLHKSIDQVWHAVSVRPPTAAPEAQAKWAAVQAMRGEVEDAQRILAGPGRTAPAGDRAEAYGAIGDEFRARGLTKEAMHPLETAVSLSQSVEQSVRWRVRLAMNRARSGDRAMAIRELLACAVRQDISEEDRLSVRELANRLSQPPMMRSR